MEYTLHPVAASFITFFTFIIGAVLMAIVIPGFFEGPFMSVGNIMGTGMLAILFGIFAYFEADKKRNKPES